MITLEEISAAALRIVVPTKLAADDFVQIAPRLDRFIGQHGKINLLIDASNFTGWRDMAAFEAHAGFIKEHLKKIDRIGVVAPHEWQHWLVGAVRMFVHPAAKAFDERHQAEARDWVIGASQ